MTDTQITAGTAKITTTDTPIRYKHKF